LVTQDRNLTCVECGSTFAFSAEDQNFHRERGYTDPKRCPSCRAKRRSDGGGGMGGGSFGGGASRGFSSGPREMHDAVCAECGQKTQVPFLPRGDKPVYCNNCFSRRRGSTGGAGGGGRGGYR
jgi:CxxC-x17-CxxC domain-containing protein